MFGNSKKLVLVLAIFAPMIGASEKDEVVLKRVPYIYYPLRFRKYKENEVKALINSSSEINAMTPTYAAKLGLKVRHIDVKAQKINSSTLETFGMVMASFQVEDK